MNLQCFHIDKFDKSNLTYHEFFWNYMNKNIPVIITSISNEWKCRQDWIQEAAEDDQNSHEENINFKNLEISNYKHEIIELNQHKEIDEIEFELKRKQSQILHNKKQNELEDNRTEIRFDFLKTKLGNIRVPIADCSKVYYNSHRKTEMNFHEYLIYWKNRINNNINDSPLYLKDWHLKELRPDYLFYNVPKYFVSDWLNEYLIDKNKEDYRFVYMGPKNSWTPFHSDVFSSFSWSTNIFGLKKWLLLPPNEEIKLHDKFGNDPFTINENELKNKNIKYFLIEQHANETVFIPSGWYHQVWNITDTISINHNWFNGCNIKEIWLNLLNNMNKVKNEIDDCSMMDNFDEHCQIMLRATFGINYYDFLDILDHILKKRIQYNKNNDNMYLFDIYKLNKFHVKFDLNAIHQVIELINDDESIKNDKQLFSICDKILNEIRNYI